MLKWCVIKRIKHLDKTTTSAWYCNSLTALQWVASHTHIHTFECVGGCANGWQTCSSMD